MPLLFQELPEEDIEDDDDFPLEDPYIDEELLLPPCFEDILNYFANANDVVISSVSWLLQIKIQGF